MKILISSFVFYPEPIGLHEHDLASGLVNLGHDVFVITGLPSYPAGVVYQDYQDKAGKWETVDGVKIYRVPFIGNRSRSPVKRIFSFLNFLFLTLQALYSQKIKPDIIRANQFCLPGFLISKLQRIPSSCFSGQEWLAVSPAVRRECGRGSCCLAARAGQSPLRLFYLAPASQKGT